MTVDKVINNNLVRSKNEKGQEVLVMGCGLGFKKRPGDPIDDGKIEKVYTLNDRKECNQLEQILEKCRWNIFRLLMKSLSMQVFL